MTCAEFVLLLFSDSVDRNIQLEIYKAQVKNVRELNSAWTHLKRSINRDLIKGNHSSARLHTKILAVVYCTWLEASFSKLIHTPYGFELSEIERIKLLASKNIVKAWEECVSIAASKIDSGRSNYVPNLKKKLVKLIEVYVKDPSELRNKVAHGQWVIALNRDNTAIHQSLTDSISNIDIVKLDILHDACKGLCEIVEALVESPNHTFHRDYWILLSELEDHLEKTSHYTLADKVALLKAKQQRAVQNRS